jgi:hypothetical protein
MEELFTLIAKTPNSLKRIKIAEQTSLIIAHTTIFSTRKIAFKALTHCRTRLGLIVATRAAAKSSQNPETNLLSILHRMMIFKIKCLLIAKLVRKRHNP